MNFEPKNDHCGQMGPYVYSDHIKVDTSLSCFFASFVVLLRFDYILCIILISLRYLNTALRIVSSTLAGGNSNVCMVMLLMSNFASSDSNWVLSDLYSVHSKNTCSIVSGLLQCTQFLSLSNL